LKGAEVGFVYCLLKLLLKTAVTKHKLQMKIFEYLNGQGGFMLLGFIVIIVVLFKKYKN
jgi:hypothetical protein